MQIKSGLDFHVKIRPFLKPCQYQYMAQDKQYFIFFFEIKTITPILSCPADTISISAPYDITSIKLNLLGGIRTASSLNKNSVIESTYTWYIDIYSALSGMNPLLLFNLEVYTVYSLNMGIFFWYLGEPMEAIPTHVWRKTSLCTIFQYV